MYNVHLYVSMYICMYNCWCHSQYIYLNFEQQRLSRACANAQTRQSLRCSHPQRIDVDEGSGKIICPKPRWIRQHGCVTEVFAHML